jgi:predicted DNA-binding transcriptional regulator YafY
MTTLDQIISAIEKRKIIEFDYEGHFRVVEPHTVGISKTGKYMLSAFQIDGESNKIQIPDWGQFSISKINHLNIQSDEFTGTRPGYTKGDSRMDGIFSEL